MRRLGCAIGLALTLGLAAAPAWGLEPGLALTQYLHRIWQTSPGLKSATIFSILQSSDGRLWLGTQSGLVRFDGVNFSPLEQASLEQANAGQAGLEQANAGQGGQGDRGFVDRCHAGRSATTGCGWGRRDRDWSAFEIKRPRG